MKKTVIIIAILLIITLPLSAVTYSGGVKAALGGVLIKNTSLSYEEGLRDALRASVTLMPASFVVGDFDLGLYATLSFQGSTSVSAFTRLLGYTGLSIGFVSDYLLTDSFSLGLSLGSGYSVTETVRTGSAFLETAFSLSYRITDNFAASAEAGLLYRKERLEFPLIFSLTLRPFLRGR